MAAQDFWDFEKIMRAREREERYRLHPFDAGGVPEWGRGTTGMGRAGNEPLRVARKAVVDNWCVQKSRELSDQASHLRMSRSSGRESPSIMRARQKDSRQRVCDKIRGKIVATQREDSDYMKKTRQAVKFSTLDERCNGRGEEILRAEKAAWELLLAYSHRNVQQRQDKLEHTQTLATLRGDVADSFHERVRQIKLTRERTLGAVKVALGDREGERNDLARKMHAMVKGLLLRSHERQKDIEEAKKVTAAEMRQEIIKALETRRQVLKQRAVECASPVRGYVKTQSPALRKSRDDSRLTTQREVVRALREQRYRGGSRSPRSTTGSPPPIGRVETEDITSGPSSPTTTLPPVKAAL